MNVLELLLNKIDLGYWRHTKDTNKDNRKRFVENLKVEDFKDDDRIHNWRNYVDSEIKDIWSQLSDETRVGIYIVAEETASNEEWD